MKKANQIFGYSLYALGAIKIILVVLMLFTLVANIGTITQGGNVNLFYTTTAFVTFTIILGFVEIGLVIGSIVMIILNIKKCPEVIIGYVMGLGAVLTEFIFSGLIGLFIQCGLYMKGGSKIVKINSNYSYNNGNGPKTTKKQIEDTNWFYEDQNQLNSTAQTKNQKKIAKIDKELDEWKELLDSGEIDEQTYNEETSKLVEKKKRL